MELRQLRYFVAVAETGNISRAAQKIFLTQPALSRQIKALEDEMGLGLFERSAHSIKLTAAGEVMLREAREILGHADRLRERVRSVSSGGRLRIGYAPSLASGILSPAVANFTQAHPGTKVEMFDLTPGEMLAGLEGNTLDVVVTITREGKSKGIQWSNLVSSPWRLAVGPKHRLARRGRIKPGDLAREPLLVYRTSDYPEYWSTVAGWLREHGLGERFAGEYDGANSLMAAVESGLGVALVTKRMAHLFPGRVAMKMLSDAPKPICIVAGHRADRADDKPLGVFIEELRLAAEAIK